MSLLSSFSKKQTEATSVEEALAGATGSPSSRSKSRKSDKNSEISESISEKKRARRRLIGAVVMVLVVVIGLPMLLDSEPQSLNKDIAIQISSVDEPQTSVESAPKLSSSLVAGNTEEVSASPSTSKEKTPELASIAKPKADTVIEKNEASAKRAKDKRTAESARALALLNGEDPTIANKTSSKTLPKTSLRLVVQVGAFTTQAKVNELRKKLTSAGIRSYTQKVTTQSGEKIRVRIGPFEDRESADKVKAQLQQLGINSSVISL